mgnify:FL=1
MTPRNGLWWGLALLLVAMGLLAACGPGAAGAVPATVKAPGPGPIDGLTPTLTATPAGTTPTVTPVPTLTGTAIPSPTGTATPTAVAAATATPTAAVAPTSTATPTVPAAPTSTPTPATTVSTSTPTRTATPTAAPPPTPTASGATGAFDMAIQKTAQCDPATQKCTFTIVVTNNGPGTFNGSPNVQDTISPAIPFTLTAFGGAGGTLCTVSGQTITCAPHYPLTLAAGATYTLTITVQLGSTTPFQNCAALVFPPDTNAANNQSCVTVTLTGAAPTGIPTPAGAADLAVQKTGQCNWPYTCAFTITVTNTGTGPYSGALTVSDQTTPPWATLLAGGGSTSGPACTFSGTAVVCSAPSVTLGPGQSQTFTFSVYFGPTGYRQPFTNCASLPSSIDGNPANNQSCLTLQPPPTATLKP